MQPKIVQFWLLLLLGWSSTMSAHAQLYAGVLGGFSSLSADSRSVLSSGSTAFASYDPKNGGALQALVGVHCLASNIYLEQQSTDLDFRTVRPRRPEGIPGNAQQFSAKHHRRFPGLLSQAG